MVQLEERKARSLDKNRILAMKFREVLIILLGALEDWLEMERSIIPNKKRWDN